MMIRRALCLVLALLLCLGVSMAEEAEDLITAEDLQSRIATHLSLNLFDVRAEDAFAAGHIPTALSFPLEQLKDALQSILNGGYSYMDTEIVVYGDTEEQSASAAEIVRGLGFTNVSRFPSLAAWTGRWLTAEDDERILATLDTVDVNGERVDVSVLTGHKLTMVNVWATYCGPCLREMPELARLAADLKDQGVQIIGLLSDVTDEAALMAGGIVAADEEMVATARQIIADTQADYPHLLPDAQLFLNVINQISAVPTTFFVDETGLLVGSVYVGSRDYDGWKAVIEDVLNQLP